MRKFYYSIIITSTILLISLIITLNSKLENKTIKHENTRKDVSILINDKNLLLENWKDSISLSQIVKDYPFLVLRIPKTACQYCKFTELNNLQTIFTPKELGRCCVMISVFTSRDLRSLTLNNSYKYFKVGSKRQNILNIDQEDYGKVYYFILNSNLQANHFHFPDRTKPYLTKEYLQMIKKKYLNQ